MVTSMSCATNGAFPSNVESVLRACSSVCVGPEKRTLNAVVATLHFGMLLRTVSNCNQ